jgi:hypothetical protein
MPLEHINELTKEVQKYKDNIKWYLFFVNMILKKE